MSKKKGVYEKYIKRPHDIILSVIALLVLFPLMTIIALLVFAFLGSPIIFSQKRPGLNEKIFTMHKFRTMTNGKDENSKLLSDAKRLTGFGRFLRCTSLDELPEFLNIIKGDMSIVGPRPLLVQYLPLYNSEQKCRHSVRPGLTGLAQVRGRNLISWEEKFAADIEYTNNITFLGDWKIILITLKKVFLHSGINSKSSATVEPFTGTKQGK